MHLLLERAGCAPEIGRSDDLEDDVAWGRDPDRLRAEGMQGSSDPQVERERAADEQCVEGASGCYEDADQEQATNHVIGFDVGLALLVARNRVFASPLGDPIQLPVLDGGGMVAAATGTTPGAGELDGAVLRIVP
jgi:hypothetical protein